MAFTRPAAPRGRWDGSTRRVDSQPTIAGITMAAAIIARRIHVRLIHGGSVTKDRRNTPARGKATATSAMSQSTEPKAVADR